MLIFRKFPGREMIKKSERDSFLSGTLRTLALHVNCSLIIAVVKESWRFWAFWNNQSCFFVERSNA